MCDPASREWRLYVDDMIRFTETALAYTEGLARATFASEVG